MGDIPFFPDVIRFRGTMPKSSRMKFSAGQSARTLGFAMAPIGPREDALRTIRVRFLDVYEPVAKEIGMKIKDLTLKKVGCEIEFAVLLQAMRTVHTSDLVQALLGPLAEKLTSCAWFDTDRGALVGVFYRYRLKAGLDFTANGRANIHGTLTYR
jgi:hypothetical protein